MAPGGGAVRRIVGLVAGQREAGRRIADRTVLPAQDPVGEITIPTVVHTPLLALAQAETSPEMPRSLPILWYDHTAPPRTGSTSWRVAAPGRGLILAVC